MVQFQLLKLYMEWVQPKLALQLVIEQAIDPLERALPLVPSMRAMVRPPKRTRDTYILINRGRV